METPGFKFQKPNQESTAENTRLVIDESVLHKIVGSIDELEAANERLKARIDYIMSHLGLRG